MYLCIVLAFAVSFAVSGKFNVTAAVDHAHSSVMETGTDS
jgi:hypothetical protein